MGVVVRKGIAERTRSYIRAVAVQQSWDVVTVPLGPGSTHVHGPLMSAVSRTGDRRQR